MSCVNYDNEANYHFTLSAMADLIRQYGYCNVINDLDALMADEANSKLAKCNCDGVPLVFEERN